jgi:predicted outer membrane lipoprotein
VPDADRRARAWPAGAVAAAEARDFPHDGQRRLTMLRRATAKTPTVRRSSIGWATLARYLTSLQYGWTLKVLLFAAAAAIAAALQLENVEEEEVFNARCAYCLLRAALAELTCSVTCSVLGRGGRSWPVVARRFLCSPLGRYITHGLLGR